MVHYVTPWLTGDIGGGLNAAISLLPEDAWVCVRDGDSMFLLPDWGRQIEQIIAEHGDQFAVIGCMTNRLRAEYQLHEGTISDEPDIGRHLAIAQARQSEHGASVVPVDGPVAGLCMIFRRSTWERHPFPRRSFNFDQHFCHAVTREGGRIGVALGLYLFHLYRWGQANPCRYRDHLKPRKQPCPTRK